MTRVERNLRRRIAANLRRAMRLAAGRAMGFDGCAVFAANVLRDTIGRDPMALWRGRYTTRRGMNRVMGRGGLPACQRRAARQLGWRRVRPIHACIGDVGLVATPTGAGVVMKLHRGEWIGRRDGGWSVVPTKAVKVAWNVCAAQS